MPDTSTSRAPMPRTEIAQRVRGIIADVAGLTPAECHEEGTVIELGMDDLDACMILSRVEVALNVILGSDAEKTFMQQTIGRFVDSVEGQVRAGCIS